MAVIKLNRTKTGVVPTALEDGELYLDQLNGKLFWADATGVIQSAGLQSFPSGTKMIFRQSSAPTGWTKSTTTTLDNAALRVVVGSATTGGSVDFSSSFGGSASTGGTALTTAQMPSHTHGVTDPGHSHTYRFKAADYVQSGSNTPCWYGETNAYTGAGYTGITIQSTGNGQVHSHSMPDIKYVDVIVATKD